jgi:hypothetical protein
MENGPFIDDFPIKTSIYKGFSMAMLVIIDDSCGQLSLAPAIQFSAQLVRSWNLGPEFEAAERTRPEHVSSRRS